MRTNINLDDGLVEDVRELWGTDGLLPDYDYKRLRNLPLEERRLSAEQEAALERLLGMNHHLGGIAPSRDELHER